jgi:hypothetical protein
MDNGANTSRMEMVVLMTSDMTNFSGKAAPCSISWTASSSPAPRASAKTCLSRSYGEALAGLFEHDCMHEGCNA